MASLRGTNTSLTAAQDLGATESSSGWLWKIVLYYLIVLLFVVCVKKLIDKALSALSETPVGDLYRVVKHLSLFVYNAVSLLVMRPLRWIFGRFTATDIHYLPLAAADIA